MTGRSELSWTAAPRLPNLTCRMHSE